jgi:uncharacterized protein YbaP (TraB family)
MNKLIYFLCGFAAFFAGCSSSHTAKATNDNAPLDKSLLWEIKGKGLKQPSYLYGTIHIIPEKDYFLPAKFQEKFNTCKSLTLEIDMSKPMELAFKMLSLAPMNDNKKLSDLLSKDDYKTLKDYMENEVAEIKMVGFGMFETYKPLILSGMLYSKLGGSEEKSVAYENKFMEMAQEKQMTVKGLETVDYQMSIFDTIPYKDQAKQLVEMIKSIQSGGKGDESNLYNEMIQAYKSQDVDKMHDYILKENNDFKGFENTLIYNRNRNWIAKIEKMAKEQPTLFAVGAGHLGGPSGVIRLLRKAGFEVNPVK